MEFLKRHVQGFRELLTDKQPESEEAKDQVRCLLVGSAKAQAVAIEAIKANGLAVKPITDIEGVLHGARNFNCFLLMIDGRDQTTTDLVYRVAQKLVTQTTHPSRVGFTIAPGRQADTSPLLVYLHRYLPNNSYYIDDDRGAAAVRALRHMMS